MRKILNLILSIILIIYLAKSAYAFPWMIIGAAAAGGSTAAAIIDNAIDVKLAYMNVTVEPQKVRPGEPFKVIIEYKVRIDNQWYTFGEGHIRGIFFIVEYQDRKYRGGKTPDCWTTSTNSRDCDIPYTGGKLLAGKTYISLVAPSTAGEYYIYVEMKPERKGYIDKFPGIMKVVKAVSINVVSAVKYKPPENVTKKAEEKTEQPAVQVYGTCKFTNIRIWTEPSTVFEDKPFSLYLSFSYTCTRKDPRGPSLKLRIRDANWNVVKVWRLGDQGYSTKENDNLWFDPAGGTKTIQIPGIKLKEGVYYITLEGFYNDAPTWTSPDWGDDPIFSEYRAYTLYVNKIEQTTKKEAVQYTTTIGTCTGKPVLYMTAWAKEDGTIMQSPAAKVGDKVYAVVKLKNEYSTCRFEGTLKIDIKKDATGTDPSVGGGEESVTLGPGDEKIIKIEFVPSEPGEYHFDVYWNDQKYGKDDVRRRYGTISCSPLDFTGCYAGPDLKVYSSTEEIAKKAQEGKEIQVTDYWFEQYGKKVTELVEGVPALGCANLTSPIDTTAKVTVQVKAFAGIKQIPIVGDIAPDPIKAQTTKEIAFTANQPVTVCVKFVPRQTSSVHNEMYYLAVLINGKEIGIFPNSKDGAVLIPKTGKGNPFIVGQDERQDIVIVDHGWYTEDGQPIERGEYPSGTYLVRAELMNNGGYVANVKVKIKIRADVDFWFDKDVDECEVALSIAPNATEIAECSFDLGDGAYHYEIYLDGKKVVSRGPTIYVGIVGWFRKYVIPVIKVIGIPGLIILAIIFFTGPFWIPYLINVFRAWMELIGFIKKR